jgi:hypothetical protein
MPYNLCKYHKLQISGVIDVGDVTDMGVLQNKAKIKSQSADITDINDTIGHLKCFNKTNYACRAVVSRITP